MSDTVLTALITAGASILLFLLKEWFSRRKLDKSADIKMGKGLKIKSNIYSILQEFVYKTNAGRGMILKAENGWTNPPRVSILHQVSNTIGVQKGWDSPQAIGSNYLAMLYRAYEKNKSDLERPYYILITKELEDRVLKQIYEENNIEVAIVAIVNSRHDGFDLQKREHHSMRYVSLQWENKEDFDKISFIEIREYIAQIKDLYQELFAKK